MEIRIKDLTKIFPGDAKKNIRDIIAVKDLDFTVSDGKLVGLLGPSGCGKSTTLYMISGLQVPTSGEVWFGDQEVTNLSPEKRGIGLVFQNYALYPHMTIYKNIEFPLTNLQVEVPLVTFFDFTLEYKYKLKPADLVEGINKSIMSLCKKIGLNKKQFVVNSVIDGEMLNITINLINVAETISNLIKDNFPKIIEAELVNESKVQTSEALYDTTLRASIQEIAESETLDVTFKAHMPKEFVIDQMDEAINLFKTTVAKYGKPAEVVIMRGKKGFDFIGRVLGLKHLHKDECYESIKASYPFASPLFFINSVYNDETKKMVKAFFKERKCKIDACFDR